MKKVLRFLFLQIGQISMSIETIKYLTLLDPQWN